MTLLTTATAVAAVVVAAAAAFWFYLTFSGDHFRLGWVPVGLPEEENQW